MTALACRDCGTPLARRVGTSGRQRTRCEPCRIARERAWQRDYYARTRSKAALEPRAEDFAPEDCQGCGAARNNGEGGRCPECSARDRED